MGVEICNFRNSKNELFTALLVDDNPVDRDIFKRILKKNGVESPVIEADDGVSAIETLEKLKREGQLENRSLIVFLDINMPQMDGFEFLEIIKNESAYKDIPVFMLTTSGQKFEVARSEKSGAMAFFNKFDVSENQNQFIHDVSICCSML